MYIGCIAGPKSTPWQEDDSPAPWFSEDCEEDGNGRRWRCLHLRAPLAGGFFPSNLPRQVRDLLPLQPHPRLHWQSPGSLVSAGILPRSLAVQVRKPILLAVGNRRNINQCARSSANIPRTPVIWSNMLYIARSNWQASTCKTTSIDGQRMYPSLARPASPN